MVENRLATEQSAYLRSAAHQPVHWYPWSREAFERATREDKPILLDIGAVWCHWCHVLDHESYDDPAAQLHRQLAARDTPARPGALDPSLLAAGIDSIRRAFDPANGGFGDAPKFPHPSTIELLLRRFARTHDDALLEMVTRTLSKT